MEKGFSLAPGAAGCPMCGARKESWIGHQVRGKYDGVLFWECMTCHHVWARKFGTPYMDNKAQSAVNEYLASTRGVVLDPDAE